MVSPRSQVRVLLVMVIVLATSVAAAPARAESPPGAGPPAPAAVSLREAIARAVRGNVDLRREGIALRTSEANIVAALGQFDFVLAADGSFTRRVSPRVANQPDVVSGTTYAVNTDLSLTRALETGGQLQLTLSPDGSNSGSRTNCGVYDPNAAFSPCNIYTPSVTLNFTQPLLRGFGREFNEANLRKSRIARDQELWNREARVANVLRDTIIAYWELAYQTGDLEIRRSAVDLAQEQLRMTEAQIQVGKMGELQAAAVRRAIADDKQEVETSQAQLMGRALDLLRLTGTPVPPRFAGLRAADAARAEPHDVDADGETTRALSASPALKALRTGITLSAVDVQTAAASLRPQLDFIASVGRVGRNVDTRESLRQLLDNDNTVGSAGFVFSLPLQNRAARGAAEAARAAEDNARLTAEDMELAIRDGAARLTSQVRSAAHRIDLARASVEYAQQNLQAEKARFEVGQSTNNDVLMRQQELKQAQISGARAAVDLLESDVALAALTGDVLDTYGVALRGLD